MSNYKQMYLVPKPMYDRFLKGGAQNSNPQYLRQINDVDVHEGGRVTIRNDNHIKTVERKSSPTPNQTISNQTRNDDVFASHAEMTQERAQILAGEETDGDIMSTPQKNPQEDDYVGHNTIYQSDASNTDQRILVKDASFNTDPTTNDASFNTDNSTNMVDGSLNTEPTTNDASFNTDSSTNRQSTEMNTIRVPVKDASFNTIYVPVEDASFNTDATTNRQSTGMNTNYIQTRDAYFDTDPSTNRESIATNTESIYSPEASSNMSVISPSFNSPSQIHSTPSGEIAIARNDSIVGITPLHEKTPLSVSSDMNTSQNKSVIIHAPPTPSIPMNLVVPPQRVRSQPSNSSMTVEDRYNNRPTSNSRRNNDIHNSPLKKTYGRPKLLSEDIVMKTAVPLPVNNPTRALVPYAGKKNYGKVIKKMTLHESIPPFTLKKNAVWLTRQCP